MVGSGLPWNGNMEKGFGTPWRRTGKWVRSAYAKGLQSPSPYSDLSLPICSERWRSCAAAGKLDFQKRFPNRNRPTQETASVCFDWVDFAKHGRKRLAVERQHGEGVWNPLAEDWEMGSLSLCKGLAKPFSIFGSVPPRSARNAGALAPPQGSLISRSDFPIETDRRRRRRRSVLIGWISQNMVGSGLPWNGNMEKGFGTPWRRTGK